MILIDIKVLSEDNSTSLGKQLDNAEMETEGSPFLLTKETVDALSSMDFDCLEKMISEISQVFNDLKQLKVKS